MAIEPFSTYEALCAGLGTSALAEAYNERVKQDGGSTRPFNLQKELLSIFVGEKILPVYWLVVLGNAVTLYLSILGPAPKWVFAWEMAFLAAILLAGLTAFRCNRQGERGLDRTLTKRFLEGAVDINPALYELAKESLDGLKADAKIELTNRAKDVIMIQRGEGAGTMADVAPKELLASRLRLFVEFGLIADENVKPYYAEAAKQLGLVHTV